MLLVIVYLDTIIDKMQRKIPFKVKFLVRRCNKELVESGRVALNIVEGRPYNGFISRANNG